MKKQPNFDDFLKVLTRKGTPGHLPFYEHIASAGFITRKTGTQFDRMKMKDPGYWNIYADFWLGLGFDCIPMEIPLNCPLKIDTWTGQMPHGSESNVVIRTEEDFDKYPWPDISNPLDFSHFETVSRLLPEGVKIVGGVCGGPFEWVSQMMGIEGIAYALLDAPELVGRVFSKVGELHAGAVKYLATLDSIGALRQGDDLGFKASTFLSPVQLRQLVFPIYKKMAQEAHDNHKPFILHSCGNLGNIYKDLIEYCKIDAKHSFEETIMPVEEFKKIYGKRITPLGGLDVDMICRAGINEIKAYTRKKMEQCFYDGYWALGTGNSLTDYMPVENYLAVLEEGVKTTL